MIPQENDSASGVAAAKFVHKRLTPYQRAVRLGLLSLPAEVRVLVCSFALFPQKDINNVSLGPLSDFLFLCFWLSRSIHT